MCSASATAEPHRSATKIDATPFLWCVGLLIHRYFFLKRLLTDIFRQSESNGLRRFGTSMNWMELAPNTRQVPTILVVSVEAAEMKYDSIETSEIS